MNAHPELWPVFVKPIQDKKFTGVIVNSSADLIGCGSCYDNAEVLCSEIVNLQAEWRVFVRYGKILDVRPYKGETILIEVNDGYSLGAYGLFNIDYAKLLSARWAELTNTEDQCNF